MAVKEVRPLDALKTYRYLRIGIIGAVALLATSILLESSRAENAVTGAKWCFQTSISSYYFTPARAIFVGSLFVIGLSLIAYKGHNAWEDFLLNVSGMLAPVVAVAPTTDWGDCWSIAPVPLPVQDGTLAEWVVTNIDNNIDALLIAGLMALFLAFILWLRDLRDPVRRAEIQPGTRWLLIGTAVALVIVALLKHYARDLFLANAHGKTAILFFIFLWLAIEANIRVHKREPDRGRRWVKPYRAVSLAMLVGIPVSLLFGKHQIFVLEAWEITAFAIYWVLQTFENWDEKVIVRGDDAAVARAA